MKTNRIKIILTIFFISCICGPSMSQESIILDSCSNHLYTITASETPNTFNIRASNRGKDLMRLKLKIVNDNTVTRSNYSSSNEIDLNQAVFQFKKTQLWKNLLSQHSPEEQNKIKAVLIDTIFRYNVFGKLSTINVLSNGKTIETMHYSGDSIQYHEKKTNGITHKTTYIYKGYTTVKTDSTNQIIEQTNFYNGEYETFIPDPEHIYPFTPFKSLKTGLLYKQPKAINENEQLTVQVLGDHKLLITVYQYNSEQIISYKQTLIKKQAFKLAGKIKYLTLEIKRFDSNNKLLFKTHRNKKGRLTLFTEKDLQEIETTFTSYERSHYKLSIEVSETHLNYKCALFSGSFQKFGNKWNGSDTFKSNGNIFITKFQIKDECYQYARYLNGKFLSGAKDLSVNFTINNLNEYENDLKKSNTILIHLDRTFHNENRLLLPLDRLMIGKDSLIVINKSKDQEKLIFQTPHSSETIIEQKPENKTKPFRDLSTYAVGLKSLEGQTLIPANFDEINKIQLFSNFTLNYCHTKDLASVISNDGQIIIKLRKGLKKEPITVSESFRNKHQMMLPLMFFSNNLNTDSFSLISLNDEVLMSGKGQLLLLNAQTMALKRDGRLLLLNRDLQIIDEECFKIKSLNNNLFLMYLSSTLPELDSLKLNEINDDTPPTSSKIKYQIVDFNQGPLNGKIYDHLFDCPPTTFILNRKGESLICNRFGLKSDTMHIEGHPFTGVTGTTALYNYNKVGLQFELSNRVNTIPPIYNEITYSGSFFARRGKAFDVYSMYGELMFSVNTNIAIDTTAIGIHYNSHYSLENIRKNQSSYYILKFNNKKGLYDPKGETLLNPDYDLIQIENGYSPNHYLFFCETHGITPNDILIKTLKNGKAQMFVLNGRDIRQIQPKLMWLIRHDRVYLNHPNGKTILDNGQSASSSSGFIYDIIDNETHITLSQYDVYGDELINPNKFKKTATIDMIHYFQNSNDKCGTLKCNNEVEIQPIYDSLYLTHDHQFLWYKWGYEKELWKLKLMSINESASDSFDCPINMNNNSPFFMYSKNKKTGLMDKTGKVLINAEFDHYKELQTGYSCILSKNNQLYVWTQDMQQPMPFEFTNIYCYVIDNKIEGYFAFRDHRMYLFSKDFKVLDSDSNLFFGRPFQFNHHPDQSIDSNDFTLKQMTVLKQIQSILSYQRSMSWDMHYPITYFPAPNQHKTFKHQNQSINTIEKTEPISFKDYKQLNWSHLMNDQLYLISNGNQTVSFGNEQVSFFTNVYIDSTLGFLLFDLNDLFKGSDKKSLTEAIYKIYLKMDDLQTPWMSKDKIFDTFTHKFTIEGDQFVFHISYKKVIKIPISELKPFMTEFWQKRF